MAAACSSSPSTSHLIRVACSKLKIDTVNAAQSLITLETNVATPIVHTGSSQVARDLRPLARADDRVYRDGTVVVARLRAWENKFGHHPDVMRQPTVNAIETLAQSCGSKTGWS